MLSSFRWCRKKCVLRFALESHPDNRVEGKLLLLYHAFAQVHWHSSSVACWNQWVSGVDRNTAKNSRVIHTIVRQIKCDFVFLLTFLSNDSLSVRVASTFHQKTLSVLVKLLFTGRRCSTTSDFQPQRAACSLMAWVFLKKITVNDSEKTTTDFYLPGWYVTQLTDAPNEILSDSYSDANSHEADYFSVSTIRPVGNHYWFLLLQVGISGFFNRNGSWSFISCL